MLIITLLFILFNILLAKHDANKISRGEIIDHRYNAFEYLALMVFIIPFTYWYFHIIHYIFTGISMILTRLVFFNISLNLFRKKAWDYISLTTTSKIDQFTNRIFGYSGKREYICYIIVFLINIALFIWLK